MVVPRISRAEIIGRLGDFGAAAGGAVAIYVAFASVALIGALVLAIDVGRLTVVRSQMQNAADAACLSATIQLDGQSGATTRAEAVARNATAPSSDYNVTSGGTAITIGTGTDGIVFYTDNTLTTTTTVDASALAMRVTLVSRPVSLFIQPALAALSSATARSFSNVGATAACTAATIICDPPALMACNGTNLTPPYDLTAPSAAGHVLLLRKPSAGGQVAPGNFSLVCPLGSCGATAVQNNLAAIDTAGCMGGNLQTKPGITAQKVNRGINSRFDLPTVPNPAMNIKVYPRDASFMHTTYGNAVWDRDVYWMAAHSIAAASASHVLDEHGNVEPSETPAGTEFYTRYQMYLYELGAEFGRNNTACDAGTDCRTFYPIPTDVNGDDDLPTDFTRVTPPLVGGDPNVDIPLEPTSTPTPDPADPTRRIFNVAVVDDCSTAAVDGGQVAGSTQIPLQNFKIVTMFVTEPAGKPSDFVIYLEVNRYIGTEDSHNLIANAKLIQ